MQQTSDGNGTPIRAGIRGILGTAGIVTVAVAVALLSTGGSYALWADSAAVAGSTVTTGTMELTVDGQPEITLTNSAWNNLLPGESAYLSFEVANEGNATASVSARATLLDNSNPLSANLSLKLGIVASAAECVAGFAGYQGALEGFTSPAAQFSPGQSVVACLQINLNSGAPVDAHDKAIQFRLDLDSTQVVSP